MNATLKSALAMACAVIAGQAVAQVTLYEHDGFQGRSFTTERQLRDLERNGFNDRASSVVVKSDRWEVCEDARFRGRCIVLRPGNYPSLGAMGLNDRVSSVRAVARDAPVAEQRYAPAPMSGQVTFFEDEGFQGRSFSTERQIDNLTRFGFNDRASSVLVVGESWEVCQDAQFNGRCMVLRPGRYASLSAMGLNDRISSVRAVGPDPRLDDRRYAPPAPVPAYDARRRGGERLYEADVTSVHAIVGAPEQRCWVEREQVAQDRGNANVPAGLAGAVIGGILGHQVGGGSGKDLATAVGAITGAVVGSNIGRDGAQQSGTRDVQRCATAPSQARPQFWDVTYNFHGLEHRVQMTAPPGSTVTVNEQGEPRA